MAMFAELILPSQSKETFRALLRTDTGESVPFSTLHNRSQVYSKLTGRRMASARLNLERYVPKLLNDCVEVIAVRAIRLKLSSVCITSFSRNKPVNSQLQ